MYAALASLPRLLGEAALFLALHYCMISFGEYVSHRHLMHRRRLPAWVYRVAPVLLRVFDAHAVKHHNHYYAEFDYEPDPVGRDYNLGPSMATTSLLLLISAPYWLLVMRLFPIGGLTFPLLVICYCVLWNVIHRQMHIPRETCFRDWAVFRYLARNHYLHHQRQSKNFNLVFPLADHLLRTLTCPTHGQIREMLVLGYLRPRSRRAVRWVERRRRAIRQRRPPDWRGASPSGRRLQTTRADLDAWRSEGDSRAGCGH